MNKLGIGAIFAGTLLLGVELAHEIENRQIVADLLHSHVELPETSFANVLSPISASGQNTSVLYRLRFAPAYENDGRGNRVLVGYDAIGWPESGWQRMSARFDTLDGLMSALKSKLGRPQPQLMAIRRTLLDGGISELGGVRSGAIFMLDERALREFGLSFGVDG